MIKKWLVLAMPFVLLLGFTFNSTAHASSKGLEEDLSALTEEEKVSYFERIDQDYTIGEKFSVKDQMFVEMYANQPNTSGISLFASNTISGSKTSNGVTVKVSGTVKDNIQNIINQSFTASNLKTSTTAGASKVTSVKTVVYHNAYGLVGSDGIGKVYSGSLSTSGKNTTLSATKKYTGIVAYASTWCTVTVKHTGGTFTINPN